MCIMLVDADRETLCISESNIRRVFSEEKVVAFTNPLEALKYAHDHDLDYVFTDVRLRPIDGYELLKAIRKDHNCLAYVVSGSEEKPDDLKWMAVNGCFTKPASLEDLTELKTQFERNEC